MIGYSLKYNYEYYELYQTGNQEILHYKVLLKSDCGGPDKIIYDADLGNNEHFHMYFTEDGEYEIILSYEQIPIPESLTIKIKHYYQLLKSIIKGMENTVCDCKCNCECNGKTEADNCCELLMLYDKFETYFNLTRNYGIQEYENVFNDIQNELVKPSYCNITNELHRGETNCDDRMIKQYIGLRYLALYFYKSNIAHDDTERKIIDSFFNVNTIMCCLQDIGLNITNIKNRIFNRPLLSDIIIDDTNGQTVHAYILASETFVTATIMFKDGYGYYLMDEGEYREGTLIRYWNGEFFTGQFEIQ